MQVDRESSVNILNIGMGMGKDQKQLTAVCCDLKVKS